MPRTILNRTGLSRGRVYNEFGGNLTAAPEGAGNMMVGPWCRDYSGLLGNTVTYMNQTSMVIADGRIIEADGFETETEDDFDEDEELEDIGTILNDGDKGAVITSLDIELTIGGPSWADAGCWSNSGGDNEWAWENGLVEYLDALRDGTLESSATYEVWTYARHWLRCPLHFALYRVPTTPTWEGDGEYAYNNQPGALGPTLPYLAHGPYGMLAAMHGPTYAAQNYISLTEPCEGVAFIHRQTRDIPYASATDWPTGDSDPDNLSNLDEEGMIYDLVGIRDTPAQRALGQNFTVRLRLNKNLKVRRNELIVAHMETGISRLQYASDPESDAYKNVLIGALNYGPLRAGPYYTLHQWRAEARYRSW